MTGAQYIIDSLVRRGVTDAFGIPGGVILRLIYEMDSRKGELMPHLSYHEQAAGFAACGYAQASGKLGIAYATRGPGFTNLISAMADAYYDSLPVLFITAHIAPCPPEGMRAMVDQEMDTCAMVKNITKEAIRLDDAETFSKEFEDLCDIALEGRKGPVLLDVASRILNQEIPIVQYEHGMHGLKIDDTDAVEDIVSSIHDAKRPVILAGDGINQAGAKKAFLEFVSLAGVPVISSRFSHDILGGSDQYFGYVGSHGMRAANFILSKCDLIVSLGNRLHFPLNSETFGEIFTHAKLIRCEVDNKEFLREIPNSTCYQSDVKSLIERLCPDKYDYGKHDEWKDICNLLKKELQEEDMNEAIRQIAAILKNTPENSSVVNDVGNNEFWVSRASVYAKSNHRTYYSKSFGALGCGLGKAIGVYYATRKPVVCFVGDQGLQMNIQELQFIAQHHLPIIVVLINNSSSGMIRDREKSYGMFLHTTKDSGFCSPDYKMIARAYGIVYHLIKEVGDVKIMMNKDVNPTFIEIQVDEEIGLTPNLPRGLKCQDMQPALPREKYEYLNLL